MILEAGIADAYGAGFEFRPQEFINQNNDLTTYFPHGLYTEICKKYTDDTQMAIAIAEALLEKEAWTPEYIADKFVEVFHRDKRRGYSNRVYSALDASKNGKDFLKKVAYQSTGNGASMRAYPIGMLKDISQIIEYCEIEAKTSHDTPEGITGAKRIALSTHYFLYNLGEKEGLIDFLNSTLKENNIYKVESPIDMHAYPTTNAVVSMLSEEVSMKACLKKAIDYGGDTDTSASLCMAIMSVNKNTIKDLPTSLYEEMEDGEYGKKYLELLDKKLIEKYDYQSTT